MVHVSRLATFALGLGLLVGLAFTSTGAPAPRYRPPPPITLVGTWSMDWGGTPYRATLRENGTYECFHKWSTSPCPDWVGEWRLEDSASAPGEKLLTISERFTAAHWDTRLTTYTYSMPVGSLEGRSPHGTVIKFAPLHDRRKR